MRGHYDEDLGCGSGEWARALLEHGYDVLGVDISAPLRERARELAPGAELVHGSAYSVELPACTAVTALGEGLGYIAAEDPREALPPLAQRVYHALRPGGMWAFDLVLRAEGEPMRYTATDEGDRWRVEVDVEEDPAAALLTRRIRILRRLDDQERRSEEVHRIRTFSRAEVEAILRSSGFAFDVRSGYGATPLPPRRLAFFAYRPVEAGRRSRMGSIS